MPVMGSAIIAASSTSLVVGVEGREKRWAQQRQFWSLFASGCVWLKYLIPSCTAHLVILCGISDLNTEWSWRTSYHNKKRTPTKSVAAIMWTDIKQPFNITKRSHGDLFGILAFAKRRAIYWQPSPPVQQPTQLIHFVLARWSRFQEWGT